jgi:hypothetical protein
MNIRLILACASSMACMLCGCMTDPPRVTGSLADKTYREDIGRVVPLLLPLPDCVAR